MRVCVPTTDVSVSQIYIKSTFSHPTVTKTVGQALTLETNKQTTTTKTVALWI